MKLKQIATLCVLAASLAAGRAQEIKLPGQATPPAGAPAAAPAAPAANFSEAQLIEEFGWFIGKRVGLTELSFSAAETESLIKGLKIAAAGKDSPYELEKIGPSMDDFMAKKQNAYLSKLKDQNVAANKAFFDKLKENKAVVETPSGLRYEITKAGDGASPKPSETVKVHYTGTLLDGTVFDSSKAEGGQPLEVPLDQVIPGWTEGLQKAKKGGTIKLYIPANLAYGDDGRPGIPPASALVFDVELLDIMATPSTPPPAPPQPTK